jgi:hypothetical protein
MNPTETHSRKMTPVRLLEDDQGMEVIFLESARFYRLSSANPRFDSLSATLRLCVEKNVAVEVSTPSIDSGVIEDVRPAN